MIGATLLLCCGVGETEAVFDAVLPFMEDPGMGMALEAEGTIDLMGQPPIQPEVLTVAGKWSTLNTR